MSQVRHEAGLFLDGLTGVVEFVHVWSVPQMVRCPCGRWMRERGNAGRAGEIWGHQAAARVKWAA